MNKENDIKLNGSGYIDPTAYKAIKKVMKDDTNLNSHQEGTRAPCFSELSPVSSIISE